MKSLPKKARTLKTAMLAAASATAALTVFGAARAAPPDEATIEAAAVQSDAAQDDDIVQTAKTPRWALWAGAAAALAALVKLVGVNRALNILAGAGPAVARVAETAARAPLKAAKAVGEAVMSPFKFALLMGGLALFAYTGVGLFHMQWTGGLATGMALVALAWFGASKARRSFRFKPARAAKAETPRQPARD